MPSSVAYLIRAVINASANARAAVFRQDEEPLQFSDARVLQLDAADSHEPASGTRSDQVDLARLQLLDRVAEGLSCRVTTERQLGGQRVQQGGDLRVPGRHRINL